MENKTVGVTYRRSTTEDIADILSICDEAREFQRSRGSMQWKDGYPSREIIDMDITAHRGYVIINEVKEAIGYCVIDFRGDSEYDGMENFWRTDESYVAIHRFAFCHRARGKGYGKQILQKIEEGLKKKGIKAIRMDTGLNNHPMHRLMTSLEYISLGEYRFSWGLRIVYEKALS